MVEGLLPPLNALHFIAHSRSLLIPKQLIPITQATHRHTSHTPPQPFCRAPGLEGAHLSKAFSSPCLRCGRA